MDIIQIERDPIYSFEGMHRECVGMTNTRVKVRIKQMVVEITIDDKMVLPKGENEFKDLIKKLILDNLK